MSAWAGRGNRGWNEPVRLRGGMWWEEPLTSACRDTKHRAIWSHPTRWMVGDISRAERNARPGFRYHQTSSNMVTRLITSFYSWEDLTGWPPFAWLSGIYKHHSPRQIICRHIWEMLLEKNGCSGWVFTCQGRNSYAKGKAPDPHWHSNTLEANQIWLEHWNVDPHLEYYVTLLVVGYYKYCVSLERTCCYTWSRNFYKSQLCCM